jgi:SAM-dependent methyltransferase
VPSGGEPHRGTRAFYENEARPFFERSKNLEVDHLYGPFLALLPPAGRRARILDAGCGSGRDSKRFLDLGYEVVAFDASEAIRTLASEYLGRPVLRLSFDEVRFEGEFDGVWACASLLHVSRREMDGALANLSRSLKSGGAFYASFRYGEGEAVSEDGRLFNSYTEGSFRDQLREHPELEVIRLRRERDAHRPEVVWLGALMGKRRAS